MHFDCNSPVFFQIRPHTSSPSLLCVLFIIIALLLQFVLLTWTLTNIPVQDENATTLNKLTLPPQKPSFSSSYSSGGGRSWPPLPTMLKWRLAWGFVFIKMYFTFNYRYVSGWGHMQVCVGTCQGQRHQNPWSWSHMPLRAAHCGCWDPNSDILWEQSESLIAEPPHHTKI